MKLVYYKSKSKKSMDQEREQFPESETLPITGNWVWIEEPDHLEGFSFISFRSALKERLIQGNFPRYMFPAICFFSPETSADAVRNRAAQINKILKKNPTAGLVVAVCPNEMSRYLSFHFDKVAPEEQIRVIMNATEETQDPAGIQIPLLESLLRD